VVEDLYQTDGRCSLAIRSFDVLLILKYLTIVGGLGSAMVKKTIWGSRSVGPAKTNQSKQ
jgi:hypothetical protein